MLTDNPARGIHIGDLTGFNSNHELHRSANVAIDRHFKDNHHPQPKSKGHSEKNNHFIKGQTKHQRPKDNEIVQN